MNTSPKFRPLIKKLLPEYLTLIILALFLCLSANLRFFQKVLDIYPWASNQGFICSLVLLLFACLLFFAALFSVVLSVRVTAVIFLLVAAASAHFSDSFGTVIDSDMLRNVLETNVAESADLLNPSLVLRLLLLGFLPSLFIWRFSASGIGFISSALKNGLTSIIALGIAAACIAGFSSQYASFFREHKPVRYYINPAYPIYSAINLGASFIPKGPPRPFQALQAQANIVEEQEAHSELIILVIGETARADHFSLNGYERETNPQLAKQDRLISYSNTQSCGTATAISVPCMFSYSTHANFDLKSARNTENGLDLLKSAGVNVLWRDNNSDSKGVADRVEYENFRSPELNPICDSECRDIGMLEGLQEYVDGHSGDTLIVLHQMGSHGPAYFARYPKEFEKFTPSCRSAELSECSQQEVTNAYDNTILYTDYFLSQVIRFLESNSSRYETAMFYVSDHGESLGESGIYLHGMPYGFAPRAQTHVPVLAWVGASSDIDYEQSKLLKDTANTHDAVFDTLMTIFEVTTSLLPTSAAQLVILKPEEEEEVASVPH